MLRQADRCATRDNLVSSGLCRLVLLRTAAGAGATRADLSRDLKSFSAGQSPSGWKAAIEQATAELVAAGLVGRPSGQIEPTAEGRAEVLALLGLYAPGSAAAAGSSSARDCFRNWATLRDGALTLAAIGADPEDSKLLKCLSNPDVLRALVVQAAFGFGVDRAMSLGKLRAALALRALERAFGNQIKTALGSGSGLSAKPSRLLAGQLLRRPKEFGTDGRLIAALAAECLVVPSGDPDVLRAALIRRWANSPGGQESRLAAKQVSVRAIVASASGTDAAGPASGLTVLPSAAGPAPSVPKTVLPAAASFRPANDCGGAEEGPSANALRPDLPGFIRTVKRAAERHADGWPGNRKAFICHVLDEVRAAHPEWGLSEIELKGMLAEAHRTGGLMLANADLKDKRLFQEFEKSAIQYKNTVWHFVRVEEP